MKKLLFILSSLFYGIGMNAQNCSSLNVHCVDVISGPTQEYVTIQDAVDAASAGDTVLVFNGTYQGFRVTTSGTSVAPLVIKAYQPNVIINTSESISGNEHIYILNSDFVTIEGFKVIGAGKYSVGVHNGTPNSPNVGIVIKGNDISNSGKDNLYFSNTENLLVENNLLHDAVQHGMYLSNAGTDNVTVRNNQIYDNGLAGIHFNGDISLGGDGMQQDHTIEGNIIFGNGQNGLNMDGVENTTIINNVFHDNGRHAVHGYQISAADGPENMIIINNSMYNNSSWAIKFIQDDGGHIIFNNVLLSNLGSIAVEHANVQSNNNIVQNQFSLNGGSSILSLASWNSSGNDVASIIETPTQTYTNPAGSNFQLNTSSAALDSVGVGTFGGINAPGDDFYGTLRPQGVKTDVGAIELSQCATIDTSMRLRVRC